MKHAAKGALIIIVGLILTMPAFAACAESADPGGGADAAVTENGGNAAAPHDTDALAGAWRTAEDDDENYILLLYPDDAFRLYQYNEYADETFMLEGIRLMDGDFIIVKDIRIGVLDADGVYTPTEEKDETRCRFVLDSGSIPKLTLTDENEYTIVLYPFDMDSPE